MQNNNKATDGQKKRIKTSTLFTVILSVAFASSVFYYDYNLKTPEEADTSAEVISDIPEVIPNIEQEQLIDEIAEPITDSEQIESDSLNLIEKDPEHAINQAAWIPSWGFADGLSSLAESSSTFSSISPVWYSVNEDGSLVDRRGSNWASLLKYQNSPYSIEILPSIGVFDADIMHTILSDNTNFNNHINAISNAVTQNGYDGIDIDYEVIYTDDKERYLVFIEELAKRLHEVNKKLSVTVLSQWGDNVKYTSFPQTRNVQDLGRIGVSADEVRIMTYDYTSSDSTTPGPIAPISWIETVIKYTTEKVSPENVWMGVHLYGYEWSGSGTARAKTYNDIPELEKIADYNFMQNHSYEEGIASYTCFETLKCTLFFQTPEGIEARIELAKKYKIAGVSYWRLGDEGDLL